MPAELAAILAALAAEPSAATLTAEAEAGAEAGAGAGAEAEAEAEVEAPISGVETVSCDDPMQCPSSFSSEEPTEMAFSDDPMQRPSTFSREEPTESHAQQPSGTVAPEAAAAPPGLFMPEDCGGKVQRASNNAQSIAEQLSLLTALDLEPFFEVPDAYFGGCPERHAGGHSPTDLASGDLGVASSSSELFSPELTFSPAVLLGTAESPPPGMLCTLVTFLTVD